MLKKIFSRFSFVALTIFMLFLLFFALLVLVVLLFELVLAVEFPNAVRYINVGLSVFAWIVVFIAVLHAANRDMVPETKIPWILCIVGLNVFGVFIYAMFSGHRPLRKDRRLYRALYGQSVSLSERTVEKEELQTKMGHWAAVSESLNTVNPTAVIHTNTRTEYYPSGELFFEQLLLDIGKAKKFIFMEYFIIGRGQLWTRLLAALEAKAQEGVEVRLMYDDVGSMSRVHFRYHKSLQKKGIKCLKFNPFVPVVTSIHNNRDHRKITVIDGVVGFTGGLNLADEYINVTHPLGYWKDTAVRLEGEGVQNLTLMFLQLYDMQRRKTEDFSPYLYAPNAEWLSQNAESAEAGENAETAEAVENAEAVETAEAADEGFVQAYGDGPYPLYDRHLGEDVYINILNAANKYVYITTPYLIIDYRMREALVLAAKRGVDVRIITPFIPDKKIAFSLTRSNYLALIRGGVKIYEYTPGFIHAKSFLADDEVATVGTINLDYRSFLFHFEDGVFMYGTKAVGQLKEDFEAMFAASALQSEEDAKHNVVSRLIAEIAKIFAPLF